MSYKMKLVLLATLLAVFALLVIIPEPAAAAGADIFIGGTSEEAPGMPPICKCTGKLANCGCLLHLEF